MLPRLVATLAPLVVALAAAAATAAGPATTQPPPQTICSREIAESSSRLAVSCSADGQFRLRISYQRATAVEPSRLVVVCEPHDATPRDFEALFAFGLSLGETHSVVLHQCPLPDSTLAEFLSRLGARGVRFVKVVSLSLLNDTMPADFLKGIDLETLYIEGVTRIELSDDFLASTGGLHNLTIARTNTSRLPERLLRHTPHLRKLVLWRLNAGRLPPTLLHGLHNLTELVASRNGLRELTREHFRDLARLRHLDLDKNQLETLPADVFAPLASLEVLRMDCNPFHSLPEPLFAGTPSLKLLRINGGLNADVNVSSLPARIFRGLDQLELLMLDRLGLQRLADGLFHGLTALRNLTLDHNELKTVPDSTFAQLNRLLNLDLSSNQLHALTTDALRGLDSVDTLYLNGNGLAALPDEMFTHTPRLGRLFLQDNNLTALEQLAFTGLDNSLWLLDLSNNNLLVDREQGRAFSAFRTFRALRELNLRQNRLRAIPVEITLNLIKLKKLDLRYNQLQSLFSTDFSFITEADIRLENNNISFVEPPLQAFPGTGSAELSPNVIHIGDNPLHCDCSAFALHRRLNQTAHEPAETGRRFLLDVQGLRCAQPPPLADRLFTDVSADRLVCPLTDGCPQDCTCTHQPSRQTLIVTCTRMPSHLEGVFRNSSSADSVSLRVRRAGLRGVGNMSWPAGRTASLHLEHNLLSAPTPALLPAGLRELHLEHNSISRVAEAFLDRLDGAENNSTRLWLGGNPFVCDCALLPLHQYLQLHLSGSSLRIMDAERMTCVGGEQHSLLKMTSAELCPSHTATIVAVCVVASVVAVCLLAALWLYYRHGEMLKVWLYSYNLCLWFVTEEELDADKKYDAFISYSHLDEQFVTEHLVPELEQVEPRYTLCLHFRDWLAGEWITDQIQRSVQESRRIIVIMSQNFIQSEWGRLEFLAAHKQALDDRRNRVIVIVYGELPDPDAMDPELRLYISMNTYLRWGDPHFWQRLRYALPHRGRRLKRGRGRQHSEKLGLVGLENGVCPVGVPAAPDSKGPAARPADVANGDIGNGVVNRAIENVV